MPTIASLIGMGLPAEFCRDGLQLFHECVTRIIASDAFGAIVDDFDPARRVVVRPRVDVFRAIRRHVVQAQDVTACDVGASVRPLKLGP
jgi:hypothetical protein